MEYVDTLAAKEHSLPWDTDNKQVSIEYFLERPNLPKTSSSIRTKK